jgi:hypothetical protein
MGGGVTEGRGEGGYGAEEGVAAGAEFGVDVGGPGDARCGPTLGGGVRPFYF